MLGVKKQLQKLLEDWRNTLIYEEDEHAELYARGVVEGLKMAATIIEKAGF